MSTKRHAYAIDVAMCWDGETPTAELRIDGMEFTGDPDDVTRAFDALTKLREREVSGRVKLDRVVNDLLRLCREAE